ncbi:MAG TPA: hypothetical protein VM146_17095 [Steroidobacteraceae bacterium]|nr:hypothetical protein [Steroidobacteraceae bacterium]
MSTDRVEVKFTCKKCGGTVLELPDNHTDDSIAKCKSCGVEFGRWRDIKAKAMGNLKTLARKIGKKTIKGRRIK